MLRYPQDINSRQ